MENVLCGVCDAFFPFRNARFENGKPVFGYKIVATDRTKVQDIHCVIYLNM